MKITDFLKKYSLINNKFIDDFYSFYDDNKNEYDYTIIPSTKIFCTGVKNVFVCLHGPQTTLIRFDTL